MKTISYRLTILLALLFVAPMLKSQTLEQNLKKYWYYRERLKRDFMLGISDEFGASIPASRRNLQTGMLSWGDATIDLGHYIAVLGTEYKLLVRWGQDPQQTLEELFWALFAFNRLDRYAETYYTNNQGNDGSPNLNGFFVRDDVPGGTLSQYWQSQLNQSIDPPIITQTESDFSSSDPRNKECSYDQEIHLLMGLGIVHLNIPTSVTFNNNQFQDGISSISIEADSIITRMLRYLQNGKSSTIYVDANDQEYSIDIHDLLASYSSNCSQWNWCLKNPVTGIPVKRGANAFWCSMGFSAAGLWLAGIFPNDLLQSVVCPAEGQIARQIFLSLENHVTNEDFKVLMLDAFGDVWPNGINFQDTNSNYNAHKIGPRSHNQGYDFIPLIHQIFHLGNNYLMNEVSSSDPYYLNPKGYYEYLLDCAPDCGPYNYGYPSQSATYEWSSTSRTIHPARRGQNPIFPGDYNGLDYMLFHNLYWLKYVAPLPANVVDNYSYPHTTGAGEIQGSHTYPFVLRARIIESASHFYADADVKYIAAQSVNLNPGFETDLGANFEAYIEPEIIYKKYATTELYTCPLNYNGSTQKSLAPPDTNQNIVQKETSLKTDSFTLTSEQNETVKKSSVVGANQKNEKNKSKIPEYRLYVFPNPTNGIFNVKFTGALDKKIQFDLIDSEGRIVYSIKKVQDNSFKIDISDKAKGTYYAILYVDKYAFTETVIYQ